MKELTAGLEIVPISNDQQTNSMPPSMIVVEGNPVDLANQVVDFSLESLDRLFFQNTWDAVELPNSLTMKL